MMQAKSRLWTGRGVSAFAGLFLLFDSAIHIANIRAVVDAFATLGFPDRLAAGIGVLELLCLVVYAIPRTAPLGAILLTGYLGGAVASQLRIGGPTYFPVVIGALLWVGLLLQDIGLRDFIPLRSSVARGRMQT